MSDVVPKDELRAAIEARKELGTEMEPAVIDSFVERVERRLAERAEESERSLERKRDHQKEMVLGAMGISGPAARDRGDLYRSRRCPGRLRRSGRDCDRFEPVAA